jgi:hypothetical protein
MYRLSAVIGFFADGATARIAVALLLGAFLLDRCFLFFGPLCRLFLCLN